MASSKTSDRPGFNSPSLGEGGENPEDAQTDSYQCLAHAPSQVLGPGLHESMFSSKFIPTESHSFPSNSPGASNISLESRIGGSNPNSSITYSTILICCGSPAYIRSTEAVILDSESSTSRGCLIRKQFVRSSIHEMSESTITW